MSRASSPSRSFWYLSQRFQVSSDPFSRSKSRIRALNAIETEESESLGISSPSNLPLLKTPPDHSFSGPKPAMATL